MSLRPFLIACCIAAGSVAATPAPPLSLSIAVHRTSLDLLDSLPVTIVVHNAAPTLQTLRFPAPSEYAIEILRDGKTLWKFAPASPPGAVFPPHTRAVAPGPTTIAVYDWNELTRDGWSPSPGSYVVRAWLLTDKPQLEAASRIVFVAPLTPSAVASLPPDTEITLAGTLGAQSATIGDANASASLSRRIAAAPGTLLVARGYVTKRPDGSRAFAVVRWAPLGPPVAATP